MVTTSANDSRPRESHDRELKGSTGGYQKSFTRDNNNDNRSYAKSDNRPYNRAEGKPYNKTENKPYNRGEAKPYNRNNEGRSYNKDGGQRPYNRDGASKPYNKDGESRPYNRNNEGRPYNRSNESRPYNKDGETRPYNKTESGRPFNKNSNYGSYGDSRPRDNRNFSFNKDDDYEGNRSGKGYSNGRDQRMVKSASSSKEKEAQPDKYVTIKRFEKEQKVIQKKQENKKEKEKEKSSRPQLKQKRANNVDWTKGYENGLYGDDDEDYTFYL